MADLADGESVQVSGSSSSVYTITNRGGVFSCSCPAWRNQSIAIETRTCKHIRRLRGDEAETLRTGAAAQSPTRKKLKPDGTIDDSSKTEAPVLLAESWDGVQEISDWWMSEKLDGVRAYWDGQQFLSRQGNRYLAPDWFTKALPNHPIDGELWLDRKRFQQTISIVRRQDQSEHWKQIKFMIFDLPSLSEPFEQRLDRIQDLVRSMGSEHALPLAQLRCKGIGHLKQELQRVESLGGEGLMLRQPASIYVPGRSNTLLKVKTFHDAEAVVVGHQPGAGRHKGRLGALQVMLTNGTEFSVGTGFSDAQRESPPPVGATITFRYQELSDGGVPRFPSYVGLRSDEPIKVASTKSQDSTTETTSKKPVAKDTSTTVPQATTANSQSSTRHFQFQDDKSNKFWEITTQGLDVIVRYGKTGTTGQSNTKTFSSETDSKKHAEKLIAEKVGKGYVES